MKNQPEKIINFEDKNSKSVYSHAANLDND